MFNLTLTIINIHLYHKYSGVQMFLLELTRLQKIPQEGHILEWNFMVLRSQCAACNFWPQISQLHKEMHATFFRIIFQTKMSKQLMMIFFTFDLFIKVIPSNVISNVTCMLYLLWLKCVKRQFLLHSINFAYVYFFPLFRLAR